MFWNKFSKKKSPPIHKAEEIRGLVLSGGGTRACYQVGALKAIRDYFEKDDLKFSVITGSSIGAVNTLVFSASLRHGLNNAIANLESVWRERTYRNTFEGSPSVSFMRSIKLAALHYFSPGPDSSSFSVFDPTPLINRVDLAIREAGGLNLETRPDWLKVVGVMTTAELQQRKGLFIVSSRQELAPEALYGSSFDLHYVKNLTAAHAFASAALPSVLPPVQLSLETGQVQLVDGGIADNIPIDPAVRFGATSVIVVDTSGRKWWCDHQNVPHYSRDPWETISGVGTFCINPGIVLELRTQGPIGPLLRDSIGRSTSEYIKALGPTWPIFKILTHKLGNEVAYEIMSYAVVHPAYIDALIEQGYNETMRVLAERYPRVEEIQQSA